MDDFAQRLERWETKMAYQEASYQDLSQRVYEQQQTIERLERRVEALTEKVQSLSAGELTALPENERPPHY